MTQMMYSFITPHRSSKCQSNGVETQHAQKPAKSHKFNVQIIKQKNN